MSDDLINGLEDIVQLNEEATEISQRLSTLNDLVGKGSRQPDPVPSPRFLMP